MALDKNFDAAQAEARLYAAWEESGAFKAGANASRTETFCHTISFSTHTLINRITYFCR